MMRSAFLCLLLAGVLTCGMCGPVRADVFLYAGRDAVYGRIETVKMRQGDSLVEVARRFDIGYNAIVDANPGLDPFSPDRGARVLVPARWLLPDVKHVEGILINLSEYRLYYFYRERPDTFVATFPVAVGDEGWTTPLGEFRVVGRTERPRWTPPPSIRAHDPRLPASMPSGAANPMGSHALRLSRGSVLIHGTNRPFGIGRRVSHGCIHLYPEDIPLLYRSVQKKTRVSIVRQPVKAGSQGGRVYVEVHRDGEFKRGFLEEAKRLLQEKDLTSLTSARKLEEAVRDGKGIPVDVTDRQEPVRGRENAGETQGVDDPAPGLPNPASGY
jgi:L,D-transpeptidase ErfK/SrfK